MGLAARVLTASLTRGGSEWEEERRKACCLQQVEVTMLQCVGSVVRAASSRHILPREPSLCVRFTQIDGDLSKR